MKILNRIKYLVLFLLLSVILFYSYIYYDMTHEDIAVYTSDTQGKLTEEEAVFMGKIAIGYFTRLNCIESKSIVKSNSNIEKDFSSEYSLLRAPESQMEGRIIYNCKDIKGKITSSYVIRYLKKNAQVEMRISKGL